MDVLDIRLQYEVAGLDALGDAAQGGVQRRPLVGGEQADLLQHLDVRPGALHVVAGEAQVEHAVVADRETIHFLRCGSTFIPKCCHRTSQ